MSKDVLIITAIEGAENCGRVIAERMAINVEIATSRRAGLLALKRKEFGVVVVDTNLVEADPEWADSVWMSAGLAMPVQVNFALSGAARLAREVQSALQRRDGDQAIARRMVATEIENELKSSVTGLLLESELALREPAVAAPLELKLRHLVELAGTLRERLRSASGTATASA